MMRPKPTDEQLAVLEAFGSGADMVLDAGAGAGKTTTLLQVAESAPGRSFAYATYNRAMADEARRKMPANVKCGTSHSFAYHAIGRQYRTRLNGPRIPGQVAAQILGINQPLRVNKDLLLQPKQLARLAQEMVTRFCHSADHEIHHGHLPGANGLENQAERRLVAEVVRPLAVKAWTDAISMDGRLKFTHDHYLKLWQLSGPKLGYDVVLLDEAQDSNPAVADIVTRQAHAQRVLVGDPNQAIYGWRGATDAMSRFTGTRLSLSQSFRFGPAVADEANKWLEVLGSAMRIRGTESIGSRVEPIADPGTMLCRTNAGCMDRLLEAHDTGTPAALAGGAGEIRQLAQSAITLKAGAGASHPDLYMFTTWGQVQDFVANDHGGADLATFVKLIDTHGPDRVLAAADHTVDEANARLVISTAHKAKGREWSTVQIGNDFPEPTDDDGEPTEPSRPEAMLAYVTVTRARHILDTGGLAWIDSVLARRNAPKGGTS